MTSPRQPEPPRDVIPALFGYFDIIGATGPPHKARLGADGQDGSLARIVAGAPQHLTPLPTVTHRLEYRDPAGRRTSVSYALEWADGTSELIDKTGLGKADSWGPNMTAYGGAIAMAATAILHGSQNIPLEPAAAGWIGDNYQLPPEGYRPAGIAETNSDEEHARAAWRQIIHLAADSPKVALVAGAALGGLYVSRLEREPFTLHLVGDSSEGKSTALAVAGAVLGDPARTVWPWNLTPVALGRALGELATLPAVVDELGAAGMRSEALESLMMRVASGAARRGANRYGPGTTTSPAWSSVLISSGNRGLSNVSTNPGLPVRVIDLPTPIADSAAAADELGRLARIGAGWPIRWHCDDSRLEHFTAALAHAETVLPVAAGGQLGRIARHLALCVAGADVLGWSIAGPAGAGELRTAALAAALDHLADVGDELAQHGRLADRLIEAVQQAHARRPANFPTRTRYHDTHEPPREADGIYYDDGTLVVFSRALHRIAEEAGIPDPLPGLRQLADRRLIERRGRRLALEVRLGPGRRPRAYIFRAPGMSNVASLASGGVTPASQGVTPPVPASNNAVTSTFTPENDSAGHGGVTGVTEFEKSSPYADPAALTAAQLRHLLEAAELRERRAAELETARLAELYEKPALGALRSRPPYHTPPADPPRERVPQPAQRAPAALAERRRRFAHTLAQRGHPDLPDALVADALERFESAARFTYEAPTPARNGMQWLAALEARYWSKPQLLREDVDMPAGKITAGVTVIDQSQADRAASRIVQYDVNCSFLNAAQSLELGTGPPARIETPTPADLEAPGFVTVTNPQPDWPAPFARQQPGPVTITTHLARLLLEWNPDEPAFAAAHLWRTHRRWLRTFARACIYTRAALLRTDDEPGRLALAVLKSIYSASLGGMLGSERHNPTAYYRPDWAWLIKGAAAASLWRQIGSTGPVAVTVPDSAYYLVDPDPPPPLELSTRPGKFKIEQTAPASPALRKAIRAGRPGALAALTRKAPDG